MGLIRNLLKKRESGIVLASVLLFVTFSVITDSFLTAYNLFNISRTLAFYVFIALGQAVVLVVGGMNLSIGSIGGLSTITVGMLLQNAGSPMWLAVVAALSVGLLCGALNGILITKIPLNAFIVTLSTSFIFTGLVYGISKGFSYTDIPKAFSFVGRKSFLELPIMFWLLLIVLAVVFYIYKYTVTGRQMLATGGNLDAARLSGVNTNKMIIVANMMSGFFAALTGILYVSRMGSAQPATGVNWMIISFAVAIIGGTALKGGMISSIGLLFGGIIMVLIKNGLILIEANVYFEQAFLGLIILLAVSLERIRDFFQHMKKSIEKKHS
jgi:ribose transport system permease protein